MPGGLPSDELSPIAKSEAPIAPKLPEVKTSKVESLGKAEQSIVARIEKDGDPDAVLQDIAKPVKPQDAPSPPDDQKPVVGGEAAPTQHAVENKPEVKSLSWEQVFNTPAGQEFYNAMRGIDVGGKQDVTLDRITTEYSMREFVRRHPREAQQFEEIFQRTYGREHPDLAQATQQVEELQKNPPSVKLENPKHAGLAYRLDQDEAYKPIREDLSTAHKLRVFGTADFSEIPLDKFMDLCNSKENLSFSFDREAEIEFRRNFPDKTTLYDQRENTRVYSDPDGMINRDRDPLFLAMFEPNSRGVAWTREEGLRQFALRYPEKAKGYAERYPDLKSYLKEPEAVTAQQTEVATPAITSKVQSTQELAENLKAAGVESQVIKTPNMEALTEAVILPRKEISTEKMLRVYRGVNQIDSSVLTQVPYAMRAEDDTGRGTIIIEKVRQEVELLANRPTYEHLLAYVNKVSPHLNERELRWLERDLQKIEDGVLEGHSLRTELIYNQIGHNGGVTDSGISPYLSASYDFKEALGYTGGNGALLVIEVPVSRIEDFGPDSSETNIKGELRPKNITAVIPRNGKDASDQEIAQVLSAISEASRTSVYENFEAQKVRSEQISANKEKDTQQHQTDVEVIRQKRTTTLISKFPELGLDAQALQKTVADSGTDIYTQIRRSIFDLYTDRFGRIGRGGRLITDYDYVSDLSYGKRVKFDRNNITDEMLYKLREHVLYQERRDQE